MFQVQGMQDSFYKELIPSAQKFHLQRAKSAELACSDLLLPFDLQWLRVLGRQ